MLRADIQGGSYAEIFKLADAVGYLHIGDKRLLEFNPSDYHTGKNPANLPTIEVPDLNQDPDFLGGLIDQIKDGVGAIGKESEAIKKDVNHWRKKVNATKTADGLNKLMEEAHDIERKAVKVQVWKLVQTRAETLEISFDKKTKQFVEPEKGEAA